MIYLESFIHDDYKVIKIYFTGKNFYRIVEVVKSIETSEYIVAERKWIISVNGLRFFIKQLRDERIDDIIVWDTKAMSLYNQWKKFVKRQLFIKSLPIHLLLPSYNKYIKTNESLLPYQTVGAHFLYSAKRVLLADVVGLGKTPQSIIAAEKFMKENGYLNTFVVVPSPLKRKWVKDIGKFLGNDRAILIDGDKTKRKELYQQLAEIRNKFVVMSYEIGKYDWEENLFPILDEIGSNRFVVIFDEAQYMKNASALRSQLGTKLSKYCNVRLALSATFIETSLLDMYNVLKIVDKRVLGSKEILFIRKYMETDFWGKIVGYKNIDTIIKQIDPVKIRRLKEQVFDQLPDIVENVYWCNFNNKQKKCYEEVLANVSKNIKKKSHRSKQVENAQVISQIQYLQQVCLSTDLLDYKYSESAKIPLLFEVIDQLIGEKIVVFCKYTKMLDLVEKEFKRRKFTGVVTVHGQRKEVKKDIVRHEILEEFNSANGGIQYLLTSDVFKYGVDMVGASTIIHLDLLWNPAVVNQRNGRIDRIGQMANKLNVIYLITEGTIEQKMWEVLYERAELQNKVLDNGFKSKRIKVKEMLHIAGIKL